MQQKSDLDKAAAAELARLEKLANGGDEEAAAAKERKKA
jgi:hypothetical protein